MGSGFSSLDNSKVVENNNRVKTQANDKKGESPFQQIIATLPKLFCEINDSKYICSCNATPNYKFLVFACVDVSQSKYYQKELTVDELKEVGFKFYQKNALDVDRCLDWSSFFSSLKNSFENKTISIDFEPNASSHNMSSSCVLGLELFLEKPGRVSIQLKLREAANKAGSLSNCFLSPLYDFYAMRTESSPAEKVDELERKLNLLKEKYIFLRNQRKKLAPVKKLPPKIDTSTRIVNKEAPKIEAKSTTDSTEPKKPARKPLNKGTKSRLDYPNEDILKFLKTLKKKLITTKSISEKEQDSLNCLINTISFDNLYKLEFSQTLSKQIDTDVVAWIKSKFSVDSHDDNKRSKKVTDATVSSSDFLKNVDLSKIDKTKTRQDIVAMFDKVDHWSFDVFTLDQLTEGQTLFITGYTLFLKYDLLNKFNMEESVLINWLRNIESGYHANPYHNAMHAADVLQALHFIIHKGRLSQYMSDEDIFASLVASIIHDYDHPGLNNAFQINSESYLATLYNDRAVLENHHCAQAFEMMRSENCNILHSLSTEQQKDVRETIIQMVLATDMSQHAKYVGKFNSRIETDVDFSAKDDVRLALQIAIKIADVSNPSRPHILYLKWADRLETEFYKQGDKERELVLGISPFMDRQKPSLNNLQHAFITYIVSPMYESFYKLLPRMKKYTKDHIAKNLAYWTDHDRVDPNDIKEEMTVH